MRDIYASMHIVQYIILDLHCTVTVILYFECKMNKVSIKKSIREKTNPCEIAILKKMCFFITSHKMTDDIIETNII